MFEPLYQDAGELERSPHAVQEQEKEKNKSFPHVAGNQCITRTENLRATQESFLVILGYMSNHGEVLSLGRGCFG